MASEFERLAYETALRGLDKQQELLKELRSRTGVMLAAASLAASFLGTDAFRDPAPGLLLVLALVAFITSIGASVYILTPKEELTFSPAGSALYEGLYAQRDDLAEVYRRLAYELDRFWDSNSEGSPGCFARSASLRSRWWSRSCSWWRWSAVTSSEQWVLLRSQAADRSHLRLRHLLFLVSVGPRSPARTDRPSSFRRSPGGPAKATRSRIPALLSSHQCLADRHQAGA